VDEEQIGLEVVFMGESEFSKFEGEDLGRKLGKMSVG
jgi:hypothetical protein